MEKQEQKLEYLKENLKVQVKEQFIDLLEKYRKQIIFEDTYEQLSKTVKEYKKLIKNEKVS